jgi:repressor LexA
MRDEGILPGDVVIVRRQATARNGQLVVALGNREATIKQYYRKGDRIELGRPIPQWSRHHLPGGRVLD